MCVRARVCVCVCHVMQAHTGASGPVATGGAHTRIAGDVCVCECVQEALRTVTPCVSVADTPSLSLTILVTGLLQHSVYPLSDAMVVNMS